MTSVAATNGATPAPVRPALAVAIGRVRCPARQVAVTVTNGTSRAESYTLRANGRFVREELVSPDRVIKGLAQLKEDTPTTLSVSAGGRTIASAERTADCRKSSTAPAPAPNRPDEPGNPNKPDGSNRASGSKLPHTGGGAETFAKAATGLATITTGGLLIFWGRLWPGSGRGDWNTPVRRSAP